MTTQDMLDKWEEYVRELYSENGSKLTMINEDSQKITQITEEEVQQVLKTIPRNRATGVDDIPAEFLQCCGPQIVKIITKQSIEYMKQANFRTTFQQVFLSQFLKHRMQLNVNNIEQSG